MVVVGNVLSSGFCLRFFSFFFFFFFSSFFFHCLLLLLFTFTILWIFQEAYTNFLFLSLFSGNFHPYAEIDLKEKII